MEVSGYSVRGSVRCDFIYGIWLLLRARLKAETDEGVAAGAGGWQNLEDPSGETVVERGEGSFSEVSRRCREGRTSMNIRQTI
jgi:hypothetical protein